MPLVTAALLAYVCGLLSGLAELSLAPLVGAAAVAWLGVRRARERIAVAALVAAGAVAGSVSASTAARCQRSAMFGAVVAILEDDAVPGAFVPAFTECGARLRIAVRSGNAPGGATVVVRGEVMTGRGGLMIDKATVTLASSPGLLRRIRDAVGRGIDARFGADAPLVRALLIADMSDISPAVRTRFASAGLSHMLSVS